MTDALKKASAVACVANAAASLLDLVAAVALAEEGQRSNAILFAFAAVAFGFGAVSMARTWKDCR